MKKLMSFVCFAVLALFTACNSSFTLDSLKNDTADRAVLSSSYGTVTVSGMSNNNLTVSFAAGQQYGYARLYLSEGNGAGLILANADMNYSNGTYTYTTSHPTYVSGSKVYVGILCNNGGEFMVPQGSLANTTSWASVTYGDNSTGSSSSGSSSDLVSGTTYNIIAKCSGKALDVAEWSTSPSTNIHQWGLGDNQANQQWILTKDSSGYWTIKSVHSGLVLDAENWGKTAGTNILQYYDGNQANQKWSITKLSDGYYKLINKDSGLALDVSGASANDGANVQVWDWNDSAAQHWQIKKVGSTSTQPQNVCTIYQDINFGGNAVSLPAGDYNLSALKAAGFKNDDLSSIKVSSGYKAILYWDDNFSGSSKEVSGDVSWIGSDWNDKMSSIKIVAGNATVNPGTGTNTGSGTNPSAGVSLLNLQAGKEMTFQFMNKTNGKFANSQIYVCIVARDSSGQFCYVTPDGNTVRITANSQSSNWSYRLDQISGFQIPYTLTSGRLFISMNEPMKMRGIQAADGLIGVVQPNLANPSDENINILFDWIEFTVSGGGFWGNTTQVDQFCFPITMSMYNDNGYYRSVGITESRDQIFTKFKAETPNEFNILVKDKRIVAPCKGGFENGGTYGNYMASYVNEVWNYYASNTLYVDHPLGTFTGYTSGNEFVFYCTNGYGTAKTGERYYISNKPTNNELFEGSGVLASPSSHAGGDGQKITVELALQAQMCAALNRHVVMGNWKDVNSYYKQAPANYYAKFWHDHSIDGFAYGYCYDDVNDQSTLIETHTPRALVIGIGW